MSDKKITKELSEKLAYTLIRRKARDGMEPCTDGELGQYVRGVVDMQAEICHESKKTCDDDVDEWDL